MLSRGSVVNGEVNTFKLSLTTSVPLQANDVIKFTFPPEVTVNAKGLATVCTPELPEDVMNCGISGNDIQIIMLGLSDRGEPKQNDDGSFDYSQTLVWTMSNIANPPSVEQSSGFTNLKILTPNNYIISQSTEPQAPVTNEKPAILTAGMYSLF